MRYELLNRYYGHKIIAPSEQAKDHVLANSKLDPNDNKPVWVVSQELPDETTPSREGELLAKMREMQAELDALKGAEEVSTEDKTVGTSQDAGSSPASSTTTKKKAAPKKKAK